MHCSITLSLKVMVPFCSVWSITYYAAAHIKSNTLQPNIVRYSYLISSEFLNLPSLRPFSILLSVSELGSLSISLMPFVFPLKCMYTRYF